MNYKKINNLIGWLCFIIASVTYISTAEASGSFWDCGEFISAAYKLQVVHQPGAPLFLMIVRLFTMLAGSHTDQVAYFGNISSAISSGFTILFLFWTITALAKKIVVKAGEEMSTEKMIAIMGSGLVGALAYTFSDTFWFSAVETEVYAMSSLATAIVFWAIFKWEAVADEPHADRWLVFIAYIMGLSIGIHLLNLLTIPALAFVYYFRRFDVTRKGVIYCAIASIAILGFVQYGIIPGIVSLAANFDLLFVNSLGMSFGSGIIFFSLLLVTCLVSGILFTHNRNKNLIILSFASLCAMLVLGQSFMGLLVLLVLAFVAEYFWGIRSKPALLNIAYLSVTFIIIGYCSFAMIIIRAKAQPNLNNSQPDNAFAVLNYVNREQYGDRPLFYGQYFNSRAIDEKKGATLYRKTETNYESLGEKSSRIYDRNVILPRIFSDEPNHISFYKDWLNLSGTKNPTMADNIKFLLSYQTNFMYWRYFMWNFAGRQNDVQGQGNYSEGNWISGIKPLDAIRLGSQEHLPPSITTNKAYNRLFFLPFILGLIGLWYQFKKDNKDGSVVAMLFFFTGMAIVLYLNQTPLQPRERDYAYAGSFYAFAIWIGLGVLAIYEWSKAKIAAVPAAVLSTALCLVAVPSLMAQQEWDDHDRSQKNTPRDFAYDYLNSCEPNAILFTMGDNDTYPLWYAQEVEGIRTDVRVCNLSLLGIDWYINQQRKKMNDSPGLDFTYTPDQIKTGKRDALQFYDMKLQGYSDLKEVLDFIGSDSKEAQLETRGGDFINFLPTKLLKLDVDSAAVLRTKTVAAKDKNKIAKTIEWELKRNYIFKNDLMVLDLIAHNNWKRPLYFSVTMPNENYLGLEDYFRGEGLAYHFVPIKATVDDPGFSTMPDVDKMYTNLMSKFKFGNMEKGIYVDPETWRMVSVMQSFYFQLANACFNEGKIDSCMKVVEKIRSITPVNYATMNGTILNLRMAELCYRADKPKVAAELIEKSTKFINDELTYYADLSKKSPSMYAQDMRTGLAIMQEFVRIATVYKQSDLAAKLQKNLSMLESQLKLS